jgi:hypothetical protein
LSQHISLGRLVYLNGVYLLSGTATHLLKQVQAPVRHGKVEHSYMGREAMTRRRKRQSSALLLLLALALLVTLFAIGCGGEEKKTATTRGAVTTLPSGPGGGGSVLGGNIITTEDTPSAFVEAYGVKPIVVLFYVPGAVDDLKVMETLEALENSFSTYVFLAYDYKTPDAYGNLSSLLDVGYPPEVILIDRQGVIQEVWNGYVDEGTLNQALVNLDQT